ncbi:MAG: glycosidase, partial [Mucilaginibacter sp.]
MKDIAQRFPQNPLLSPADLKPSAEGLHIACLLNPGVFRFDGKVWLLVRVAERPMQGDIHVSFPILTETGETKIMEIALNDQDLIATDTRVVRYKGVDYLTTLSHLRLLCSDDGL